MYMSPIIMMSSMVMVLSTLMVLTSTNWICLWISMELNMFSFIPIMMSTKNNLECEASIKYFINQAFASCIMIIMSFMLCKMSMFYFAAMPLLVVSMMLKLGSSPCYMWFPSVMKALPWIQSMVLATWQKIAPMMILLFNIKPLYFMMMIISMMNIFIGGCTSHKQVNIQSLLAYSSIAHMGWMFSVLTQAISMVSIIYFIIYLMILLPVFIMMMSINMKNLKMLMTLHMMPVNIQLSLMLMLLSLAGLPPLSGFLPKLMILFTMSDYSLTITLMMVIFSFMSLYFYLNLAFSVMMLHNFNMNLKLCQEFIILLYAMIMFMMLQIMKI
uniref:NADH-ubiquinone oxidoreductase chain 2 n=1 Tax=Erpobdella japonica TaxID=184739 RepID=A0A343KJQ1_9ANNE|nr:NADH dehydrogenase subunit 2 [Erpobdella japonica]ATG87475.1 NADH dehydrogenase subunit 2 [Erpobdella japonica]